MPLPVHLICGPLGVGKTTAILDRLQRTRGSEFTAVLVNDFGPVGLDGPIIESALGAEAKVDVKMVPGGCVCCTAAAYLTQALAEVARRPGLDRLLIEPSGLAAPDQMVDLLRQLAGSLDLEVRPVIVLLDPARVRPELVQRIPYWQRFVEVADILVANRCDRASAEQVKAFADMAASWDPPKRAIVTARHGAIPDEVWEMRDATPRDGTAFIAAGSAPITPLTHAASAHARDGHAGGLEWPADVQFDADAVGRWLHEARAGGIGGRRLLRLKSLLNTNQGWRQFELASDDVICRPTSYRAANRLDWIADAAVDAPVMRAAFERLRAR